jgi:hypothetical protein
MVAIRSSTWAGVSVAMCSASMATVVTMREVYAVRRGGEELAFAAAGCEGAGSEGGCAAGPYRDPGQGAGAHDVGVPGEDEPYVRSGQDGRELFAIAQVDRGGDSGWCWQRRVVQCEHCAVRGELAIRSRRQPTVAAEPYGR